GVDAARAVRVRRRVLQAALRQSVAPTPPAAPPADLDSRRRLARDDAARRRAGIRLHGHPVLPHLGLRAELRALPAHLARGRPRAGPVRAGPPAPDLRGRDRRAGAGRVRAALLVLRAPAVREREALAPRLHLDRLGPPD